MDRAIHEVISYMYDQEEENFIEYMTEEKGRNPKYHIFYNVLVMLYKDDEKKIRKWMRKNIPQEATETAILKKKPMIIRDSQ
jgi:hypothetical protein